MTFLNVLNAEPNLKTIRYLGFYSNKQKNTYNKMAKLFSHKLKHDILLKEERKVIIKIGQNKLHFRYSMRQSFQVLQHCTVHLIRNLIKYVPSKDYKKVTQS